MDKIQVALVDDHCIFRNGLAKVINTYPGYKVIFEADNGKDFINKINLKFKPEVVLLDINMPEMNGPSTAEWLSKNYPEIAILVLSMFDDSDKVLAMISLGVKGYILKDSNPEEFKKALDVVSHSGNYFPPFITKYLVNNFKNENHQPVLNNRELEFIKLASTELTYKEIADKMYISPRTVDGYRDQLFEKLNTKSRVGLVLYAIKNKLVEL